jgi:hypothetical protein
MMGVLSLGHSSNHAPIREFHVPVPCGSIILVRRQRNLVNVHIHQFQPGGAVVDAAALAQFQEQWATYRKLVESDCLATAR